MIVALGIDETSVLKKREILDACQDDLVALIQAWMDRGMTVSESAQLYAAVGIELLAKMGASDEDLVEFAHRHITYGRAYRG